MPVTHIYDHLFSWLGTGTSLKSDESKLVLWAHAFIYQMKSCH
jgi:hypothetical protein